MLTTKQTMKHTFTLLLIVLLTYGCKQSNNQLETLDAENKNLESTVDSLMVVTESLTATIDSLMVTPNTNNSENNYWYIPNYDGEVALQRGIKNPEEFIETSFRNKPDLIPMDGVLGGTMRYGNVQILSDKWLIADFNDGHIEGKGLYKYTFKTDGSLEFKLLEMTSKQ